MIARMYKILRPDGSCAHGGKGNWHLPSGRRPGRWLPAIASPVLCTRGYHLVPAMHILQWLQAGYVVWEAEGRGARTSSGDKVAYGQARLLRRVGSMDERALRLFAADCAERILPIFERDCPADDRPRRAIEAARGYCAGTVTREQMAAAWDAARDAARAAAWDAARAAAWAAAGDAAWAARDAAGAAARAAAQRWQTRRLLAYLRRGADE